jgi:hypothetical protein
MNEDIVIPLAFFGMVVILALGIPLVRAWIRRSEQQSAASGLTPALSERLDRIEAMVETVQIEMERMAEGQRFTSRLLSEGAAQPLINNARGAADARTEVEHA